jgi:hypothetical protein
MAGKIAERPLVKNGEASISSALRMYSSQAVEHHARQRSGEHSRYGARQHESSHRGATVSFRHRETQHGNVVEMISRLTHNLA